MRLSRVAIGIGFVAALAAGCGGGGSDPIARAATVQAGDTQAPPSITAQGVGKATGVPDTITVGFSLHTEGASAQETLADNSGRTQSVLDALKGQGVDDKDVQTTNVSVGPRYDNRNPPRIIGYAADNAFVVKLRDLGKAGAQIDALVGVGGDALQVQGIGFSIGDPTATLAQARADAVKRAADQAKQMADAAGAQLGALRSISEVPVTPANPYQYNSFAAAGIARDASQPVPIQPGSQDLSVTVTVVFDIR